ncbi:MAG: hypothetical protein CTY20_06275 [Hyphomicrobium sp.]|nr:MAG: hypothetical protein CTY20_06275 [Hyphomicrobium sp.]
MKPRRFDTARVFSVLIAVVTTLLNSAPSVLASEDPKVPSGRDPSGIPVAIIGPGIDYLAPEVSSRLARDGEGDIIGWDFIDGDLRPYEAPETCTPRSGCDAATASGSRASQLFLAEADRSRLIVLRTKDGDRGQFASAVAFASKSPARIIPTFAADATGAGPDWDMLIQAARRFSNLLFIVPAYGPAITIPGFESMALGNLLVVAPAGEAGDLLAGRADAPPPSADVAATVDATDGRLALRERAVAERAAARVAAMAARLYAKDPVMNVHELKARLLQLAKPLAAPHDRFVRSGWFASPRRHDWAD